jgi:hypothetical protein
MKGIGSGYSRSMMASSRRGQDKFGEGMDAAGSRGSLGVLFIGSEVGRRAVMT